MRNRCNRGFDPFSPSRLNMRDLMPRRRVGVTEILVGIVIFGIIAVFVVGISRGISNGTINLENVANGQMIELKYLDGGSEVIWAQSYTEDEKTGCITIIDTLGGRTKHCLGYRIY